MPNRRVCRNTGAVIYSLTPEEKVTQDLVEENRQMKEIIQNQSSIINQLVEKGLVTLDGNTSPSPAKGSKKVKE
jgi:hypothetical protein